MKTFAGIVLTVSLLSIGAFILNSSDTYAQETIRTGIKVGLNASSLFYDSQGVSNKNERIGFHAGVFTQVSVSEFFVIQPELLYMTKGSSANYNTTILGQTLNGRNTFKLNYAELPVLATFKLGQSVELQAGPYIAYLLNSSINTNENFSGTISRGNFNKIDYGLAGGLTIYFGKAFVGLRYEQGLQRIAESGIASTLLGNAKNSVGLLSVGFSLK